MKDDPLLAQVEELAKYYDWLIHHQRPAMLANGEWRSTISGYPGWPDLVLVHYRRRDLLFVEVKSAKSRLTDDQESWLTALRQCGCDAQVWRPANLEYAKWRLGPNGVPSRWFDIPVDRVPCGRIEYNQTTIGDK